MDVICVLCTDMDGLYITECCYREPCCSLRVESELRGCGYRNSHPEFSSIQESYTDVTHIVRGPEPCLWPTTYGLKGTRKTALADCAGWATAEARGTYVMPQMCRCCVITPREPRAPEGPPTGG